MTNELDKTAGNRGYSVLTAVLGVGLVAALAGDGYLLKRSNQLKTDLIATQESTQAQISKISDATQTLLQQRVDALNEEVKAANATAESALKRAQTESQRQSRRLAQRLDEQQKQVSGELATLKDATATASTKINEVSTDVSGVKTDVSSVKAEVASTQSELEKHGLELKRVVGDMGVMSGLIATNSKDLAALRELGDRNYIEFSISKRDNAKRVGDIMVALKKADTKRNRYTVDITADDKRLEKKDKTINEPVQLYVSGNRQPYEIVVNEVRKDQIVGYLATPKVKMARR
jgi:prophage DNA circulation protein